MSNVKDISIRGTVPFNLHEHEPMGKFMAQMLSPAFGINMGYDNFRPTMVEHKDGKTAYYPFWITGTEAVTCYWIKNLLQCLVDCGGTIDRVRVDDLELDQKIVFDIPVKTPSMEELHQKLPVKPRRHVSTINLDKAARDDSL